MTANSPFWTSARPYVVVQDHLSQTAEDGPLFFRIKLNFYIVLMYFGPAENRKAQALSATGIRPFALTFDIMEMDLHVNWPKCQDLLQHIQKQPVTGSVPPQLIEGVRIQELPPGKGFALNLRQLRFVAEIRIA